MELTKKNEVMLKVNKVAKDEGIEMVFEEVEGDIKMKFYIADLDKFKEDYIKFDTEGNPVPVEIEKGDLIRESEIHFDEEDFADDETSMINYKYRLVYRAEGLKTDYIYFEHHDGYPREEEFEPLKKTLKLATYAAMVMNGYTGEFSDYMDEEVDDWHLYE